MDLGSEQAEKQSSKKLKARGKGDECRGVVLDQCFDSHISDLQVMVLARFSLPEKLEIGTLCIADLQKLTRVLLGTRERGVPRKGGQLSIISCPFRYCIYMSVPITYL